MRAISLIFLILSLTNGSHAASTTASTPSSIQPQPTEPFTRVVVQGNIDVKLYTGDTHPRVILHGDPNDVSDIQTKIQHGILYVNVGKGCPHFGRVGIDIRTHYLTFFSYHGAGNVTADNLQSGMIDLSINNKEKTTLLGQFNLRNLLVSGSGFTQLNGIKGHLCKIKLIGKPHVRINGVVNLTSLTMAGKSSLSLFWVNSRILKIRAKDNAFLQIAGVVDTLDLALNDHARFNGRYLRGTDVFVKTFGHAVAEICATKTQHTLASGASNIYFYNLPKMKADFMAWNGAVLDMREWELPETQEYTRYNR